MKNIGKNTFTNEPIFLKKKLSCRHMFFCVWFYYDQFKRKTFQEKHWTTVNHRPLKIQKRFRRKKFDALRQIRFVPKSKSFRVFSEVFRSSTRQSLRRYTFVLSFKDVILASASNRTWLRLCTNYFIRYSYFKIFTSNVFT